MSKISYADADYRISRISFDTLIQIQQEAEDLGFSTRWISMDKLCSQVDDRGIILLQSLLREERAGELRAYRCFVLFKVRERYGGAVRIIDIAPERFRSLERIDRDPDVRKVLSGVVFLAVLGISGYGELN